MASTKKESRLDAIESLKKEADQLREKLNEDRKNLNDAECKQFCWFNISLYKVVWLIKCSLKTASVLCKLGSRVLQ